MWSRLLATTTAAADSYPTNTQPKPEPPEPTADEELVYEAGTEPDRTGIEWGREEDEDSGDLVDRFLVGMTVYGRGKRIWL